MARKVSAAEAKAKKEKKVLIGLGVVLLAVGVIQGPKLMKQLKGKPPPTAAPVVTTSDGSAVPSSSATTSGGGAVAASPIGLGHLQTFTRLPLKDPFHALVANVNPGSTSPTDDAKSAPAAAGAEAASKSTNPLVQEQQLLQQADQTQKHTPASASSGSATVGFTSTTPKAPPPPPPNAAMFKTNGKKQLVFVGDPFPATDPVFKLVKIQKKTAKVGVLGGSFTSGAPTVNFKKGTKITLANQADGTKYVITLVKLTNATPPPAAAASGGTATPAPAQPTTTPATTTPTTTTP